MKLQNALGVHKAAERGVNFALRNFPDLPDDARVPVTVVADVFGIGVSTCWAWVKSKRLPAPYRLGRSTRWKVGELRVILNGGAA
jgi:predicted DNA-binding transcriptional regulator AlpA